MRPDFDYLTIEPDQRDGVVVYGHGTYGENSVLEGQALRQYLKHFETIEEAKVEYPTAEVLDHSTKEWRPANESLADASGLPSVAPAWFDPADAGERWDDDY